MGSLSLFLFSPPIFLLKVGLLVVDEVHMVGEKGGRGANLEALLTKVISYKLALVFLPVDCFYFSR